MDNETVTARQIGYTYIIDGNRTNEVDRTFQPVSVRYIRLYVIAPTQSVGMDATRIYEFELY